MENKSFMEISKEECLDSVEFILENSERHFRIAKQIATENEFGMATAHIVLGAEELTKALFLFMT